MDSTSIYYHRSKPTTWNKLESNLNHNPMLPPRILLPAGINRRLNEIPLKTTQSGSSNNIRQDRNKVLLQENGVSSFALRNTTMTTQPPMVWFPGNSDCSNQSNDETGKHKT